MLLVMMEPVVRTDHFVNTCGSKMQVLHGGLQGAVSQEFFYGMQVGAIINEMCCKTMSDGMHRIIFTVESDFD